MIARRSLVAAAFVAVAFGCDGGEPAGEAPPPAPTACAPTAYPAGPYGTNEGELLEGRTFEGIDETGAPRPVVLGEAFAPCAPSAATRPLVIRVQAAFCGTCRNAAKHGADILPEGAASRVRIVDVLVRDEDGEAPAIETARRWQTLATPKVAAAIDPSLALVAPKTPLPRVLVVDPRTMRIRASLADPAPERVASALDALLAEIDGRPIPPPRTPALVDGRFTKDRWQMILGMTLSGPPPRDRTNRHGDDPVVAELGRELFEDPLLSPSTQVSCTRCHERHRSFTDGSETATGGVAGATRNTPTVVLAAWSRWQLWDGRADSLWMQALLPFEDPSEFGSSRLFIAHQIFARYRDRYEAHFGPMPPLDDAARFPPSGKPGDPAWEGMTAADRDAVTAVFVNVGKSIAAFERSFRVFGNALEDYARERFVALTDVQRDGLLAFFEGGCAQCHYGGRLTDDAFHNVRFPTGRDDFVPDRGRIDAPTKYDASEFRVDGRYADEPQPRRAIPASAITLGAFRTPALRGVVMTPPFGHGGSVPSLTLAVDLHRTLGMPEGNRLTTGEVEPWLVPFDAAKVAPIVAFLQALPLEFGR